MVLKKCAKSLISLAGSTLILLSSPLAKNISLCPSGKSSLQAPAIPSRQGAFRDRHERGTGCGGRRRRIDECASQRTAKSCGPDAPTLASNWRRCSRIAPVTVAI
jgi:hypothetical protein